MNIFADKHVSARIKVYEVPLFHVICDDKKWCRLTPRFNGSGMVAPPDGVHCGNNDTKRKARYLLTHFDQFHALIIVIIT